MTLHRSQSEVGVRELHDRLSEYLERVPQGERSPRSARVKGAGTVSDLVSRQRA